METMLIGSMGFCCTLIGFLSIFIFGLIKEALSLRFLVYSISIFIIGVILIQKLKYNSVATKQSILSKYQNLIILGFIIGYAALIRLLFFNGIGGHDDWAYLFYTRSLMNRITEEAFNTLWGMRQLIYMPIVGIFSLTKPSYTGAFLPTFAAALGEIALIYLLTKKLFQDSICGYLAAAILALYPLNTFCSTTIRGDIEVSLYSSLSVYLFILSHQFLSKDKCNKDKGCFLYLTGVLAGVATLVKETCLMLFFLYFILFLIDSFHSRKILFRYVFIIIGILTIVCIEGAFYYSTTGNFFNRFLKGTMHYHKLFELGEGAMDKTRDFAYLPCLLFNLPFKKCYALGVHNWNINNYISFDLYFYLFVIGILYLLCKKDRHSYFVMIWATSLVLYLEFGSDSLLHYFPIHKEPRYLTIASLPVLIIIARATLLFLSNDKNKVIRLLIIITLMTASICMGFFNITSNHTLYGEPMVSASKVYDFVKKHPKENFWADYYMVQYLELKTHYHHKDSIHGFKGREDNGFIHDLAFINCGSAKNTYLILTKPIHFYSDSFRNKTCLKKDLLKQYPLIHEYIGGKYTTRIYYISDGRSSLAKRKAPKIRDVRFETEKLKIVGVKSCIDDIQDMGGINFKL